MCCERTSSTAESTAARMPQARSSSALDGRHARLPSALMAIQKLAAARPSRVHRVRGMMPLLICTCCQTAASQWTAPPAGSFSNSPH